MKVTVIIPCYNSEEFIWDALQSVEQQTYKHIEVIVINDGSTDQTGKLLDTWNKQKSLKLKIIETENQGASAARNRGLEKARGEYIQFLDADDLLMPNKISRQADMLNNIDKEVGFIAGSYKVEIDNGKHQLFQPDSRGVWFGLISSSLGCTPANLFSRSMLEQVNGFDIKLKSSQEYDLMFRMLKYGDCSVVVDDEANTIVRSINPNSISNSNEGDNILRFIELRKRMLEFLKESEQFTVKLHNEWKQTMFHAIKMLYEHKPSVSVQLFRKYLGECYIPNVSGAVSVRYRAIFSIFGYSTTQKIYSLKKYCYELQKDYHFSIVN